MHFGGIVELTSLTAFAFLSQTGMRRHFVRTLVLLLCQLNLVALVILAASRQVHASGTVIGALQIRLGCYTPVATRSRAATEDHKRPQPDVKYVSNPL